MLRRFRARVVAIVVDQASEVDQVDAACTALPIGGAAELVEDKAHPCPQLSAPACGARRVGAHREAWEGFELHAQPEGEAEDSLYRWGEGGDEGVRG